MYLYRTQVGIKFIDYIGLKYKKTLRVLSFLSVFFGYILMSSMIFFLWKLVYIYLFQPKLVQAIKVPPLMPLVPYVPELFKINYLPPFYFTYWIIAIAVIAIFHEFAHGIFARRYGVEIKTTGFGFLGPFLAAFVEPDENVMQKKPKFQQIAILSAGTFANLILTCLFVALLLLFSILAYAPAGATFDMYATGIEKISSITMIDGIQIKNQTSQGIIEIINKNNLKDSLIVGDSKDSMNLTEVIANETKYLIPVKDLKSQLEQNSELIIMYQDFPAIRNRLKGAIIQMNDNKIRDRKDLAAFMENHKPGDKIKIITKTKEQVLETEIILGEDSNEKGKAMIGVGYVSSAKGSFLVKIFKFLDAFKEQGTYYEAKYNADLTLFIYNLIWWLVLINFSVALINMWPVAIFDGGRVFLLTVWAITGSEKFAQILFKALTYLVLGTLVLLMYGWAVAVF